MATIKVRLKENSPYSEYGYYRRGDIGYLDGYTNGFAVIILENGEFAKANLDWIKVVDEDDSSNTGKDVQKPSEWSEEDEINLEKAIWYVGNPAPMVVKDSMLVEWLKSLKGRVQPRQEWSEEDETMIALLHNIIGHHYSMDIIKKEEQLKLEDWLKSLRPQSQWKPSEEQMNALSKAIAFVFDSNSDVKHSLESLYNELKKL